MATGFGFPPTQVECSSSSRHRGQACLGVEWRLTAVVLLPLKWGWYRTRRRMQRRRRLAAAAASKPVVNVDAASYDEEAGGSDEDKDDIWLLTN